MYSNLWIALSAITMTAKTLFLVGAMEGEWYIYGFVFCATLLIYAGHRVMGLKKVKAFKDKGRYKIIAEYKNHIILYAVLGGIGTLVCASFLSWKTILLMVLPGLISLGYIIPFFVGKEKKRLRDFNFIKIFFVAGVWMWVSVVLPLFEMGFQNYEFILLSMIEIFLFVFAITLPFDIRDVKQDQHIDVKTIPSVYGEDFSRKLAMVLLVMAFVFALLSIFFGGIDSGIEPSVLILSWVLGYGITGYLIWKSSIHKPDYFYTFYLDGTMILLPIFVIGMQMIR